VAQGACERGSLTAATPNVTVASEGARIAATGDGRVIGITSSLSDASSSMIEALRPSEGVEVLIRSLTTEINRRWSAADSIDQMCHYAMLPSGKLLRPLLLLESCLAVTHDIKPAQILSAAIGSECGHVASLIHDDIIDGDIVRRNRPSVHHQFGTASAIVAGDALIFYLYLYLSECSDRGVPSDRIVRASHAVSIAGLDLCRGQQVEGELTGNPASDVSSYLGMARLKTGACFRGVCECGAILGGGSPNAVRAVAQYADDLGIAFQIWDDVLPYIGQAQVIGKPVTSDIANGRITLPVILAYRTGPSSVRRMIDQVLGGEGSERDRFEAMRDLLERTSALDQSHCYSRRFAERAASRLEILPRSRSREVLRYVTELATERGL
jgi:geranylgeranyl pyrophosphate synthase